MSETPEEGAMAAALYKAEKMMREAANGAANGAAVQG